MPANDPVDRRQPDAGALEFRRRMQALKHAEQLRRIGHVETGAVVAHEIGARLVVSDADFDPRLGAACAVNFQALPIRFSNAIGQQPLVAFGDAARRRRQARPGGRAFDCASRAATVRAMALKSTGARWNSPRVTRESASRSSISRAICCAEFADIAEILLALIVELVAVVLQQYQAEAVDAAQRRPQIMRHRIAEGFQLLVLRLRAPRPGRRALRRSRARRGPPRPPARRAGAVRE